MAGRLAVAGSPAPEGHRWLAGEPALGRGRFT